MISPGPVFKIRTDKLKGLSANFVGDVITSSPIKEIINTNEVYGFNYNCTFYNVRFPLISNLLFFFFKLLKTLFLNIYFFSLIAQLKFFCRANAYLYYSVNFLLPSSEK